MNTISIYRNTVIKADISTTTHISIDIIHRLGARRNANHARQLNYLSEQSKTHRPESLYTNI
jgi:hypothetical protein